MKLFRVLSPAPRYGALALASAILYGAGISAAWAQHEGFGGVRVQGVVVVKDKPLPTAPRADVLYRASPSVSGAIRNDGLTRSATSIGSVSAATRASTLRPAASVTAVQGPTLAAAARTVRESDASPATGPSLEQTLFSDSTLFSSDRLCAPLQEPAIRNQLNGALKQVLVTQLAEKLPGGFDVHSQTNHQLGSGCSASAEIVGNRVTVRMRTLRNRFFARITTPDGIPGGLDPNFFTHYDIDVLATFLLPTSLNGRVEQESLSVGAVNVDEPQTRSVTGNLALAANGFVQLLGGPDFIAKMREDRYFSLGSLVSVDLGQWNRKLGLAGSVPDARIENSFRGDQLLMHITQRAPDPGPIVH